MLPSSLAAYMHSSGLRLNLPHEPIVSSPEYVILLCEKRLRSGRVRHRHFGPIKLTTRRLAVMYTMDILAPERSQLFVNMNLWGGGKMEQRDSPSYYATMRTNTHGSMPSIAALFLYLAMKAGIRRMP
jgi:hypothetical protein